MPGVRGFNPGPRIRSKLPNRSITALSSCRIFTIRARKLMLTKKDTRPKSAIKAPHPQGIIPKAGEPMPTKNRAMPTALIASGRNSMISLPPGMRRFKSSKRSFVPSLTIGHACFVSCTAIENASLASFLTWARVFLAPDHKSRIAFKGFPLPFESEISEEKYVRVLAYMYHNFFCLSTPLVFPFFSPAERGIIKQHAKTLHKRRVVEAIR